MAKIYHMRAQPGDTELTDLVTGNSPTYNNTGRPVLTQDLGLWVWHFPAEANTSVEQALGGTYSSDPYITGDGVTIMYRFRMPDNFALSTILAMVIDDSNFRLGTTDTPEPMVALASANTLPIPIDESLALRTVVAKWIMRADGIGGRVTISAWYDKPSQGDNTPDEQLSSIVFVDTTNFDGIRLKVRPEFQWYISDYVIFDEELSNADCESAAYDLDAYLGQSPPGAGPVLSNPTGAATGPTTAAGGVDTDTLSDGTVYEIASFLATPPNETELKAGQMSGGTPADWSENQATTGANPQAWSATGLTTDTEYRFFSGQENAALEFSNIIASPTFTPATIAALTNPTGVATSDTEAAGGFDTDTLSQGDAYAIVSTSATPPTWAQLQAGQESGGGAAPWSGNQPITGANPQALSATGLAADTAYYFHFGQLIGAGESNITQSAQFTTQSPPAVNLTFEPLTRNNGLLFASETGLSVRVYSDDGLTVEWWTDAGVTDALGVLTPIQDPAIVDQIWYKVDCWRDADGFRARTVRVQATL